jgi:hypothetical protein
MVIKEIMCLGCELHLCRSGYGPMAGSCEHGDQPSGSIKGGEFVK